MGIRMHFPTVLSSACGFIPAGKKCGAIYINDQTMPQHDLWQLWQDEYRSNPEPVKKRLEVMGLDEQIEILESLATEPERCAASG